MVRVWMGRSHHGSRSTKIQNCWMMTSNDVKLQTLTMYMVQSNGQKSVQRGSNLGQYQHADCHALLAVWI